MMSGWGPAADRDSMVRPHRHPDSAGGARPECAIEYGLMALGELAGDPAAAETQVRGDSHVVPMGTGDQDERETETGDRTGQRALLACSMM